MEEHWSIDDLKNKFSSLTLKVGDEYVCKSTIANRMNYFKIVRVTDKRVFINLQYTQNNETGEIKHYNVEIFVTKENFIKKKKLGLYRKL